MKLNLHWALVCALALPSFVSGADEEAKNAVRIKWARGVLTDFWDAMVSRKYAAADGLISQGIREGAKPSTWTTSFSESLVEFGNAGFTRYKVESEEADPDGSEVRFEGYPPAAG